MYRQAPSELFDPSPLLHALQRVEEIKSGLRLASGEVGFVHRMAEILDDDETPVPCRSTANGDGDGDEPGVGGWMAAPVLR